MRQDDLYTWGWNSNGELGIESKDKKVHAIPTLVDFKNEKGEIIEINVKKVECGNSFTICLTGIIYTFVNINYLDKDCIS